MGTFSVPILDIVSFDRYNPHRKKSLIFNYFKECKLGSQAKKFENQWIRARILFFILLRWEWRWLVASGEAGMIARNAEFEQCCVLAFKQGRVTGFVLRGHS